MVFGRASLLKREKKDKLLFALGKILRYVKEGNVKWFYETATYIFLHFYTSIRKYRRHATSVLDYEWDNLIILDACRYDSFVKLLSKTPNEVPYIFSKGSATSEFLLENFKGKKLNEVIYVTGNPYINRFVRDSFYKIVSVWDFAWDEGHNTVMPEDIVRSSLKVKSNNPTKKLIIHFMQPHYPFINCPKYTTRPTSKGDFPEFAERSKSPWEMAKKGKANIKEVWEAYEDNLRFVLPYALKLAKQLKGKTIISSDHGNIYKKLCFPPFILAGHPPGIYFKELIKVPWFTTNVNSYYQMDLEKRKVGSTISKLKKFGKI